MQTTSLFTRITQFAERADRNPSEERLTEAFAAVLRASREAAVCIVEELLHENVGDESVSVSTQRYTAKRDRVDVEIRFGPAARPTLLVWFELKWNADPDADQLRRYRDALDELRRPYRLALIAPRDKTLPPLD